MISFQAFDKLHEGRHLYFAHWGIPSVNQQCLSHDEYLLNEFEFGNKINTIMAYRFSSSILFSEWIEIFYETKQKWAILYLLTIYANQFYFVLLNTCLHELTHFRGSNISFNYMSFITGY